DVPGETIPHHSSNSKDLEPGVTVDSFVEGKESRASLKGGTLAG
ncbi:hypothetical protein Tco_0168604, partial [Tanacetum coccineum]